LRRNGVQKSSGLPTLFLCLPLLFFANAAHAQGTVDQEQPVTAAGPTYAVGGSSDQKLAQSFTVGLEGALTEIHLPVSCSSGELIVEIQSLDSGGRPSGRTVASGRVPARDIGPPLSNFRPISLEEPLDVLPGQHYAIIISNPTGTCGMLQGPEGNSYGGGTGFFDARPNRPGWIGFKGGPGSPDQPQDLPFKTVVDTTVSSMAAAPAIENGCFGMTASGTFPLPFDRDLPICNCLSDPVLNEWRCRLLHPDFFIIRRIPFPLNAGGPFTEEWAFTPLTELDGAVSVEIVGAGMSKLVTHVFGENSKPGTFEYFRLEGVVPKQSREMMGMVRFSYPMKTATSKYLREFGFDSTIRKGQIK
jgi:hypothetical protein